MKPSRNTFLLALAAVVILGGAFYYFFILSDDTDPAVVTDTTEVSNAELEFISLVAEIDPIVFDTAILADPRFTSRQDLRTAILPEDSGREDPFAPI